MFSVSALCCLSAQTKGCTCQVQVSNSFPVFRIFGQIYTVLAMGTEYSNLNTITRKIM